MKHIKKGEIVGVGAQSGEYKLESLIEASYLTAKKHHACDLTVGNVRTTSKTTVRIPW